MEITVPFEVKQAGEENDGFFHIRGLASTYAVDLGDDEIIPGAFSETILNAKNNAVAIDGTNFKALLPSLWQHNHKEPTGTYVELEEVQEGLIVHSIHPLDDDFVRGRVKPQVKVGSVRKMSIGYGAKKFSFREEGGRRIRTLEVIDLGEISLVTFPMNQGATIMSAKNMQYSENVKSLTDSGPEVCRKELVSATIIAHKSRVGVDMSSEEKDTIINEINAIHKSIGRSSPIENNTLTLDVESVKCLTERQLEGMLSLESVKFSTQASTKFVSCLKIDDLRDANNDDARDAKNGGSDIEEKKMDEIINLLEK